MISDPCIVLYGIPQGTACYLFFYLHKRLFLNVDISGDILIFADDTILFSKDDNWTLIEKNANYGLSLVN